METKKTGITYRKETDSENAPWQQLSNIDELIWDGIYLLNVVNDNGSHNMPLRITDTDTVTLVVKDHALGEARTVVQTITRVERSSGKEFIYTRTRCNTCGEYIWSEWTETHKNIELGEVDSFDIYTESGNYSGVYTNGNVCENFSMVVIDNKAVASAKGEVRSVSQFKYSLNLDGTFSFKTRIGHGNESVTWNSWVDIGAADTTDIQDNSITAQKLSIDVREEIGKVSKITEYIHGVTTELNSRLGSHYEKISLLSADLLPTTWDGAKMVNSTDYNIWIIPLHTGRTYQCLATPYIVSRRTCSEYPSVGKELEMNGIPFFGNSMFVSTPEMKYLVITVMLTAYDNSKYEIAAYEYGLIKDVKQSFIKVQRDLLQQKREIDSYIGSYDRTFVLTSGEYDGIIWDGEAFIHSTENYNGFVIKIYPGQRVVFYAPEASNVCTLSSYPTIGSTGRIRTSTELNGEFVVQENEHYLFLDAVVASHTFYKVITDKGAINPRVEEVENIVGSHANTISLNSNIFSNLLYDGERFYIGNETYNGFTIPLRKDVPLYFNFSTSYFSTCFTFANEPAVGEMPYIRKFNPNDYKKTKFTPTDEEKFIFLSILVGDFIENDLTYTTDGFGLLKQIDVLEKESLSLKEKTILCLGDSITEFTGVDGKKYSDHIIEKTGATVINCGIGGTKIARRRDLIPLDTEGISDDEKRRYAYAALDISSLAVAIRKNDFSFQESACAWLKEDGDDNTAIIDALKQTDISSVDIIVLFAGANDVGEDHGTIGSIGSDNEKTNMAQGFECIIRNLLLANPNLRIYYFTPIPRYFGDLRDFNPEDATNDVNWCDNYHPSWTDTLYKEDIDFMIELARHFKIPNCDMYNSMGINQFNIKTIMGENSSDGAHPIRGFKMIANRIVSFIKANQ